MEVEDEDAAVVAAHGEEVRELRVEVQSHDARLCVLDWIGSEGGVNNVWVVCVLEIDMTCYICACGLEEWEREVYMCAWRVFRSSSYHTFIVPVAKVYCGVPVFLREKQQTIPPPPCAFICSFM